MTKVYIYNNGRLLDMYIDGTKFKFSNDVVSFIKKIENDSISKIKVNNKDITFNTSIFEVFIKDYENLKNYPLFDVLKVKLNREYRKEKLRNAKLNRLKLSATAIVLASSMGISMLLKENVKALTPDVISNTSFLQDLSDDEFIENVEINETIKEEEKETEEINCQNFYIDINYNSRIDSNKYINCKETYGDIITKYATMYGLDPNLMIAVATQESGVHNPNNSTTGAIGLMQIEKSVWNNKEITVYNFDSKENETLFVTEEKMKDLETNIKIACMIMRQQIDYSNNNIPVAISMYNKGYGNIKKIIDTYANDIGKSFSQVLNDFSDYTYLTDSYYKEIITVGDKNYLENVLSYMGDDPIIKTFISDNSIIEINVCNTKNAIRF